MSTAYPNPNQEPIQPQPADAQPAPAPAQPEKKKGGCLKWGGIGLGVIVLLSLFASCGGGDDTKPATETTTAETMTVSEEAPTSEAPASEAAPAAPAKEDVPVEFKNALKKADSYANRMHMSESKLYDQLTSEYGEKFSPEAAQYAIENVNTDYNANALEKAKSYRESMAMSPDKIYDQLVSEYGEAFTPEQAQYAIDNLPQ